VGEPKDPIYGKRFGMLVALAHIPRPYREGKYWLYRCDCGGLKVALRTNVNHGDIKCCGCIRHWTKHGASAKDSMSSEYSVWTSMRGRCKDTKSEAVARRYHNRGIRVCRRWDSFENFLKDMGPKPSPKHTIERKNNDRGYCPSNCRWATQMEQNRNKCTNVFVSAFGESKVAADWMKDPRCRAPSEWSIGDRIRKGWPHKKAIVTPATTKNGSSK
jgi:hypothetical protein